MKERGSSVRKATTYIGSTILVISILLSRPVCADAQQPGIKLAVSPMRTDINMPAGQSHTEAMRVVNDGTQPAHLRAWPADWYFNEKDAPQFERAGSHADYSCGSWVKVNPTEFEVPAHGSAIVRYTTTIPAGTPEAGYHCGVAVETTRDPNEHLAATGLLTLFRFVNSIYVKIGNPEPQGEVTSLELVPIAADAPGADGKPSDSPHWEYRLQIHNPGRTHIRVTAKIELRDAAGNKIDGSSVDSQPVLPEISRTFKLASQRAILPGDYRLVATIDIGRPALLQTERPIHIEAAPVSTQQP